MADATMTGVGRFLPDGPIGTRRAANYWQINWERWSNCQNRPQPAVHGCQLL